MRLHENKSTEAEIFFTAIRDLDLGKVKSLVQQNEILLNAISFQYMTPLVTAAGAVGYNGMKTSIDLTRYFVEECGADVNETISGFYALNQAVNAGDVPVVELLLKHGANPNCDRELFSAMRDERNNGTKCVELLIQHGVDVNRVFAMFGDRKAAMSALDRAGKNQSMFLYSRRREPKPQQRLLRKIQKSRSKEPNRNGP